MYVVSDESSSLIHRRFLSVIGLFPVLINN